MLMIGTKLLDRYAIESEVGRGGLGVVYSAHDTLLDRLVAIKFLTEAQLGSQGRARLLHEAQMAAKLNHPNIINIYDAFQSEGSAFIVMELVQGKSLYEYHPATMRETLEIARQICLALDHAHRNGIIHRDLKPENVIIDSKAGQNTAHPAGTPAAIQVKLTDFGLARSVASRISVEGAIIGTVFYIAPEQALGKEIDGRADLYSLGVMLYELTSGKLPFSAEDPLAVISQHLYAPVIPPSSYNPEIPADLEALIMQMMSKDAADRPANAIEALEKIDQILSPAAAGKPFAPGKPATPALSPLDRLVRGRLVGREAEFAEARQAWKAATVGATGRSPVLTDGGENITHILLISGEAGVGKTPLVREVTALAEVSGGRVLHSTCYPDSSAPYTPISQLLRQALPAPVPALALADLLRMAPDLQASYPDLPPNPPLDPQSEQQRLFESMATLCNTLAAQNPLLLVIEDVQWADYGSLALIRHLARRSHSTQSPPRLLIVMTYRDIELDEGQALNDVLFDLTRERLATRIKLCRFDKEQTRKFLEVMFQQEIAGDEQAEEFLNSLYRETEGNMFYIEEVCRALVEEGIIYHENGHWRMPDNIADIQIPQSVRLAVQSRLNKLPASTQEALRVAAVIGREFDFQVLQQASEMNEDALVEAIEPAERAQLISESSTPARRSGEETFFFFNGLTMTTLREGISGLRRRRLHRRVAAAIQALHPDDYEALAFHYLEAGDEAHALDYYRQAGDRARLLYANQEAIRAYSQALSILGEEDDPALRTQRFELLSARTTVYNLTAQRQAEKKDVEDMLAIAESTADPQMLCDANLAWAGYLQMTNSPLARQPAEKAAELARQTGDLAREGNALHLIGQVEYYAANNIAARHALEAAIERLRGAGKPAEAAASLHLLSLVLKDLHEDEASLKAVQEALALSRQAGNRRQEAIGLRRLAIYYNNQSRLQEALPVAEEALRLHRELGDRSQECHAIHLLGILQAQLGRHEEAEQTMRQGLEVAWDIQMSEAVQYIAGNLVSLVYHRQGAHEQALMFVNEQINRLRKAGFETAADMLVMTRLGVLFDLADYPAALVASQAIATTSQRLGSLNLQARIKAITGMLHAELGDFDKAYEHLQSALVMEEESEAPFERAEILSRLAYVHFLNGGQEHLLEGLGCAEKALEFYPGSGIEKPYQLAELLTILAAIQLSSGQVEAALERSSRVPEILKDHLLVQESEYWLLTHASILYALGRAAEGDEYLRRAYQRVQQALAQTQNPEYRRSLQEISKVNREIIAKATERNLTAPAESIPD